MKVLVFVLVLLACSISMTDRAVAQSEGSEKTLILYYSRTGNTKAACQELAKAMGSDIMEVKDLSDRSGGWGFFTGAISALFNMLTDIEPEKPDLKPYSRIIVAGPIWSGRLATATRTFMAMNRFDGKKVLVFSTTNVLEKEPQREKARGLVEEAGGTYCGHFQIAVTEKVNGKKTEKGINRIVQETVSLVPAMEKTCNRP